MSTLLFLVRHGESTWNAQGRVQGQADPPLSPWGVRQAEALARALQPRPLAAVYSSPLLRARQTAAMIGDVHGLRPRLVDALREVHLGIWQGLIADDLDLNDLDGVETVIRAITVPAPGGETLYEAAERAVPAIDGILANHRNETVVVVAHSIIGRAILCHLLKTGLELVSRLKLKQCSITMLRLGGEGVVLERLGDTCHLHCASDNAGAS
jgi:broad specificity phosphatase PhoE